MPTQADLGVTRDVKISVSDGKETVSLSVFDLSVVSVNDSPTLNGTPDTTAGEDEEYSFGTPHNVKAEKLIIKLTATDESNASVSNEFVLNIAAPPNPSPNLPPVPNSSPSSTPTLAGEPAVLPVVNYGEVTKRVNGTSKSDKLAGSDENDLINGRAKDDRVKGHSGEDRLIGGKGNDKLNGGAGNDRLDGRQGNDKLLGGSGDDLLIGGLGRDTLIGGAGRDVFVFSNNLDLKIDEITDFEVASDLIDLRPIFSRAGYENATLAQVVRLESVGTSTTQVQVDSDGLDSGIAFITIASLSLTGSLSASNFAMR